MQTSVRLSASVPLYAGDQSTENTARLLRALLACIGGYVTRVSDTSSKEEHACSELQLRALSCQRVAQECSRIKHYGGFGCE
jgi:hypothetical protein